MTIVRKQIRMDKNLADWYEKRAEEMNVSQSNLIKIALTQYVEFQDTMKLVPHILEHLKENPSEGVGD